MEGEDEPVDCSDPFALEPEALEACNAGRAAPAPVPGEMAAGHEGSNLWYYYNDNGDGTATVACGEWHAPGSESGCSITFQGPREVRNLFIYRCTTALFWSSLCDHEHLTEGTVHNYPDAGSTGIWYITFHDGQEVCRDSLNMQWRATFILGGITDDPVPPCQTNIFTAGIWGAGARYWIDFDAGAEPPDDDEDGGSGGSNGFRPKDCIHDCPLIQHMEMQE